MPAEAHHRATLLELRHHAWHLYGTRHEIVVHVPPMMAGRFAKAGNVYLRSLVATDLCRNERPIRKIEAEVMLAAQYTATLPESDTRHVHPSAVCVAGEYPGSVPRVLCAVSSVNTTNDIGCYVLPSLYGNFPGAWSPLPIKRLFSIMYL